MYHTVLDSIYNSILLIYKQNIMIRVQALIIAAVNKIKKATIIVQQTERVKLALMMQV